MLWPLGEVRMSNVYMSPLSLAASRHMSSSNSPSRPTPSFKLIILAFLPILIFANRLILIFANGRTMDKSRREREIWGLQRFLWEPEPRNARNRTSCDTEGGYRKIAFGLSSRNSSTRLSWCRESKAACGATRNLRQPLSVPPKAFPRLPW